MKQLKLSAILLSSILLTACGGGGGNNPSSNLNFPASATLAEANEENGEKVAKGTISKNVSYLNSVENSSGANSSLIAHNVSNILSKYVENLPQSNALNVVKYFDRACDVSGTISGSVNTDTAAYTITFNNCINNGDGAEAINGSAFGTVQLDNNDKELSFSLKVRETLKVSNSTMDVGSSMDIKYSVAGDDNKDVTITMSATGTENNQKYGCKVCKFHTKVLANNDIQIYQTEGQLYIGDDLGAYVIYDTSYDMSTTPFVFLHGDGKVNVGGIAKFKSKDNKIIEIKAVANGNAELWIDGVFSKRITL
ncbi:hypothetical protein MNB_SUP05-SYMBIONT-4-629 [hydrothermal vent metagenome]|uniref:Lipoprotein n=1 Tax=hydrothermal vent metagenome TaxID=652676 RepID=A0A1W1DX87_9ZZZZ